MSGSRDKATTESVADDSAREERWVKLYTELTGASDAVARACWMYLCDRSNGDVQLAPVSVARGSLGLSCGPPTSLLTER